MKNIKFSHQLGTTTIHVNDDGTAVFRDKTYSSYKSARRALTKFYGFAYRLRTQFKMPCPINEKDLCSDVLFDDLFDDNSYCRDGHGTLVGFINRCIVKVTYNVGTNVVTLKFFDSPITYELQSMVRHWLGLVCASVNDNHVADDKKLQTTVTYYKEMRTCKIVFEYLMTKE